jgi:hypothetical protein
MQYPVLRQTKKSVPRATVGTAKQFVLWEDENKRGKATPGPVSYDQQDQIMQRNRHEGRNMMGFGSKATAKAIKVTPGPADYSGYKTNTTTGVGGSGVNKVSHNFKLNRGGLERPPLYNYKEYVKNGNFSKGRSASSKSMKKSFSYKQAPKNAYIYNNRAGEINGENFGCKYYHET